MTKFLYCIFFIVHQRKTKIIHYGRLDSQWFFSIIVADRRFLINVYQALEIFILYCVNWLINKISRLRHLKVKEVRFHLSHTWDVKIKRNPRKILTGVVMHEWMENVVKFMCVIKNTVEISWSWPTLHLLTWSCITC